MDHTERGNDDLARAVHAVRKHFATGGGAAAASTSTVPQHDCTSADDESADLCDIDCDEDGRATFVSRARPHTDKCEATPVNMGQLAGDDAVTDSHHTSTERRIGSNNGDGSGPGKRKVKERGGGGSERLSHTNRRGDTTIYRCTGSPNQYQHADGSRGGCDGLGAGSVQH